MIISSSRRALGSLLLFVACAFPMAGTTTQTAARAERIVSLNGSNTEILFALGVGDQVVGRDDSAIYPPEVSRIPSIGYQYQLSAEGVLSMRPTLVLGKTDVKPAVVVEQIRATGVRVELVREPSNLEEAAERILVLGRIVNRPAAADRLVAELKTDIAAFEKRKEEVGARTGKKAAFLYFRGPKNIFVLGNETAPGKMLSLVGAENVLGAVGHAAPVTVEALIAAQPEVIVTFTHGVASIGGVDAIKDIPGVAHTPAGRNGRFVIMDDLFLGGFTNRAGRAALDLLEALQEDGITEVPGR